MNPRHIVIRSAAALVLAAGSTSAALAAVCHSVTFMLTNQSDGPVLVQKVGYRDLNSSNPSKRWVENVKDFSCPAWQTCSAAPQNLGSVTNPRLNHDLTDIVFYHSHMDIFGNWLPPVWSSPNTPFDMTCTDNRTYGAYDVF